jgi:hypothetical protein
MVQEVRSRWSSPERERPPARQPVEVRSSWSTSRADGFHIAGHVGKAASSPVSLKRRDASEVIGENQPVIPDRR